MSPHKHVSQTRTPKDGQGSGTKEQVQNAAQMTILYSNGSMRTRPDAWTMRLCCTQYSVPVPYCRLLVLCSYTELHEVLPYYSEHKNPTNRSIAKVVSSGGKLLLLKKRTGTVQVVLC